MQWKKIHIVIFSVLLTILSIPTIVRSADVDDLKASTEQLIAALNKRDLDSLVPLCA
jgi:hypothetical protein